MKDQRSPSAHQSSISTDGLASESRPISVQSAVDSNETARSATARMLPSGDRRVMDVGRGSRELVLRPSPPHAGCRAASLYQLLLSTKRRG